MDRKIDTSAERNKKRLTYIGLTLIIISITVYTVLRSNASSVQLDKNRLSIAETTYGSFSEYIPVEGIVVPKNQIFLDAVEGGRVVEKYVRDGDILNKGQAILRLENTDLKLDMLNKETQALDLINSLQNTRQSFDNNRINRLSQLSDIDFQLKEAERVFKVNENLYREKVISEQEYLQSKNNFDYQKRKKQILEQASQLDSITASEQISQFRESYKQMQKNLNIMHQKQNDLLVCAPVAGQLNNFRSEVGELKTKGQNLGQIDVPGGYKIRALIDEHFLNRVNKGYTAEFDYGAVTYQLRITAIFPQVSNGRFEADMEFEDENPPQISKGQNIQLRLKLGDPVQCCMIPKGAYYQQTGGQWIYVLEKDGRSARKREIRTGRQNPRFIEVSSGLNQGEKVIISSYQTIGEYDIIHFTSYEN